MVSYRANYRGSIDRVNDTRQDSIRYRSEERDDQQAKNEATSAAIEITL